MKQEEEEVETMNAVIENVRITTEGIGLLSVWITLDYGVSSQGFGGYNLYIPKSFKAHEMKSFAGHFIYRVMEIAGVSEWEKLVGKTIRVCARHTGVVRIGHIIKDDWFCPEEELQIKNSL